MSKVYKIVTSQIETSSDNNREPNTFSYNTNGEIVYYDSNAIEHPVMDRGILFGANYDSSDQSNLNTIKLIPDSNSAFTVDQYLIVEPTGPDHIHIRSGGTIDESRATLILGGERNAVVVGDDERAVAISTRPARLSQTYTNMNEDSNAQFIASMPTPNEQEVFVGWKVLDADIEYTVNAVTINTPSEGLVTITATGLNFVTNQAYTFYYDPTHNHQWVFNSNGVISGPAMGGTRFVHIRNAGYGEDLGIYSDDADLNLQSSNDINITATDGNVYIAAQDGGKISLSGTDGAFIGNPEENENRLATYGALPFITVAAPASSIGIEGHVLGLGAITNSHIYYCTGTYDGTTHIWKRVAWSNDTWGA
jgi:hypothetical protein